MLLAVGRTPNTHDLGLAAAGLSPDARGVVPANERLESAVSGIWALGDCNGWRAFTHTSWNDHEIVDADTGAILGTAILGRGGSEAIHAVLGLMTAGMPSDGAGRADHRQPVSSFRQSAATMRKFGTCSA